MAIIIIIINIYPGCVWSVYTFVTSVYLISIICLFYLFIMLYMFYSNVHNAFIYLQIYLLY